MLRETTIRPMDGAVEHPRMDLLRVDKRSVMASLYAMFFSQLLNKFKEKALR
ncbi:hypothetical protein [Shewanella denitrificans]|jgi:hypothetical protein|uniref:hypothetical protein n=1 Tax=Shewanella denitrificans TaxID=192073 RepID=UPI000310747E|nr:hypothetical protein [Shewanella denitrificans]